MNQKKKLGAAPALAERHFQNLEIQLFQQFIGHESEQHQLSNTIDLWDSVPRYAVSRQAMAKMRTQDGFLDLLEIHFDYKGTRLKAVIQAARIREEDGTTLDYYPSATEELIEDALRKIAACKQQGFFDKFNYRSGVVFSLHMLREELKKSGHTRSFQEIVKSLKILSGSLIEIQAGDGKDLAAFSRTNYLPALTAVSRKKLRDNPEAKWMAQFHPMVTQSVDALTYRQFNYHQMMAHSTQLARWLHRQLSLKFTFATDSSSFEMGYGAIKRDSALINYARERDGVAALTKAFEELCEQGVLLRFEREDITGNRSKIHDVKYILYPTPKFVRDMKHANKRMALAVEQSIDQRVAITFNSVTLL